jgi:hypothetical protein
LNKEFFDVGPVNHLAGGDWALLVDANMLTQDPKAKTKAALESAANLNLLSDPVVEWDPSGPAIRITAGVELVDACPTFLGSIDMDVDVEITVTFSTPTPNTFRTHFRVTGELSDFAEEFACALNGALLWPFIAPILLESVRTEDAIRYYFAGLVAGPPVVFVALLVAIAGRGLSEDLSDDLECARANKSDFENYSCDSKFDLLLPLSS